MCSSDLTQVSHNVSGSVYIAAAVLEDVYSQRNLADDVYDGVFEALTITETLMQDEVVTLFDAKLQGFEKLWFELKKVTSKVITWFIEYL